MSYMSAGLSASASAPTPARFPARAAKERALRSLSLSASPAASATPVKANAGSPLNGATTASLARLRKKSNGALEHASPAEEDVHTSSGEESKENYKNERSIAYKTPTIADSTVSVRSGTAFAPRNAVVIIESKDDDDFQPTPVFQTPVAVRRRSGAAPNLECMPRPGPITRSVSRRSSASSSSTSATSFMERAPLSGFVKASKRPRSPEATSHVSEDLATTRKLRTRRELKGRYADLDGRPEACDVSLIVGDKGMGRCSVSNVATTKLDLSSVDSEEDLPLFSYLVEKSKGIPLAAVDVIQGKACAGQSRSSTCEVFGSDSSLSSVGSGSSDDDFEEATSGRARSRVLTRCERAAAASGSKNDQDKGQEFIKQSKNSSDIGDEVSDESESSDPDAPDGTESVTEGRPTRGMAVSRKQKSRAEKVAADLHMHHPQLKGVWADLDKTEVVRPEPASQPENLKLRLLPFQRDGVGWMCEQELGEYGGGILADEMGMGKTIQTISLLLLHRGKPTLVVCPTVALGQWQSEISTHTGGALSVLVYHGAKRECSAKVLKEHDVVLTTYSIIESSFRQQEYGAKRKGELVKTPSLLHSIHFFRIVLDEAHSIKDRSCNTARATFALKCDRKWSLSGTPLQNRVGELYSQIRFLEIEPYSYYYCRQCDCKSLHWRFSNKRTCDDCDHHAWMHVCWWNAEILKPIQKYGTEGEGRKAFTKLQKLLSRLMLRRTKVERADDLGLPPRVVSTRKGYFNEEEMDFYESLFKNVSRQFSTYVANDTVLHNYANIFELLMRMRQAVNHPDLVTKHDRLVVSNDAEMFVCAICSDEAEDPIMSRCRHVFCREDARDLVETAVGGLPTCPQCFVPLQIDLSQPTLVREASATESSSNSAPRRSIVNRIDMDRWRSSTKIEVLVEELDKLRRGDATIKSIVFSQFIRFLQLVAWRLKRAGFECVMLDGSMTPAQRDAAIKAFSTNPHITVFLVSLKAGGVALNLTEASQIFLLDAWWNPQVMNQAADRIHRLGQHRPIRITRIVIENSIESRIIELQQKKEALFQSTIGGDQNALNRLTKDDLQFLFCL